jgi:hypothetical protein
LDNQQIFASRGIPSRADLEKVIRQKDKK